MPALCQCGFYSESLRKCVSVNVIVPQNSKSNIGVQNLQSDKKLFPVIYLLHGLSDDQSIWMRRTSIELFAAAYECIIVMPDGGRSFYRNMASGALYKDFIAKDLPDFIESTFPAERNRENRFICGLSMGGYGALAIGLEMPDRYAKIAAFSSVADIQYFSKNLSPVEKKSIFGDIENLIGTEQTFGFVDQRTAANVKDGHGRAIIVAIKAEHVLRNLGRGHHTLTLSQLFQRKKLITICGRLLKQLLLGGPLHLRAQLCHGACRVAT